MGWRLIALLLLAAVGDTAMEVSGDSWAVYIAGSLLQITAIMLILHLFYRSGFRDGVASVPLDGAGLASGDDRAFDSGHRWNPALRAWERAE